VVRRLARIVLHASGMADRLTYAWMVCLLASLAGCGDDGEAADASAGETEAATGAAEDDGPTQGASDGAPETASSGASGDDSSSDAGGEPEHIDLFTCAGVTSTCDRITQHIDSEPLEALECAGQLVTSGEPGVISALNAPGPNIDETESLILVLGDGMALVQTRERHCDEFDEPPCSYDTLEWEPSSEHQLCTIEIDPELEAACDPACETDCNCAWDPFFNPPQDCQAIDDWSCDDALAALAGSR
jgi:hypothetical protein